MPGGVVSQSCAFKLLRAETLGHHGHKVCWGDRASTPGDKPGELRPPLGQMAHDVCVVALLLEVFSAARAAFPAAAEKSAQRRRRREVLQQRRSMESPSHSSTGSGQGSGGGRPRESTQGSSVSTVSADSAEEPAHTRSSSQSSVKSSDSAAADASPYRGRLGTSGGNSEGSGSHGAGQAQGQGPGPGPGQGKPGPGFLSSPSLYNCATADEEQELQRLQLVALCDVYLYLNSFSPLTLGFDEASIGAPCVLTAVVCVVPLLCYA